MKIIKEFWKQNKMNYLFFGLILTLGAFFIYSKQHPKYLFNLTELIITLPFLWIALFILGFCFALIFGGKD